MRRWSAVGSAVALTAAVTLVLAGCTQRSNLDVPAGADGAAATAAEYPETPDQPRVPGRPGGTFRLGIVEPTAIDPYNAQESEGILVTKALFTGLVNVRPNGEVYDGVASAWTPNADCSQWTFTLKPGTTFSNGEPVDSAAFKRGWERTAAPDSGSAVSYHLNEVAGFDQMQDGTAATLSGVDAADPNTLRVALSAPDCEFALRTAAPPLSPVPTVAGPAGNTAYNDLPIGNGPFTMDGPWRHDTGIRLVRNDTYGAGPKANLDAVELTITPPDTGALTEYNGFNNGQFDWARMPVPVQAQARAANEPKNQWISKKTAGINYLQVQVQQPPLNSVAARKAISMAIDRNAIAQGVFQGSQVPATAFLPASFTGAFQDGVCDACRFDPVQAKELAAQAGLTGGTRVAFQFNSGSNHDEWTAAVKQQLERNLGIAVDLTGVPFRDLLTNQRQPTATGLFRAGWSADYPTPSNFLASLLTTKAIGAATPDDVANGDNRGRYSNPAFDELVARAVATPDVAARNDLYKQAEKIAIGDDLGVIPLFARQQFRLVNTTTFGNVNMDFWENPTLPEITLR
jgi:oligopeptide transport system substrate-binding protein